jgi:amidase
MSLVGLGSDYGGSIRWPAQCAGLVGLRPTVGRVSRAGEQPTLPGSDPLVPGHDTLQDLVQVVGPLARCVDDLDLVLRVIAGADGLDPLAVDASLGDYRAIDMRHVEVRWGVEVAGAAVDPTVGATVRGAVDLLRSAGATVVEGLPNEVHEAVGLYDRLRETEPMLEIDVLDRRSPQLVGEPIASILAARRHLDSRGRKLLFEARALLVGRLGRWLRDERVLVLPVSVDVPRDLDGGIGNFSLLTPSRAISLFGIPAVSVPVARAGSGAPVSVQVVAPAFREDVALAVASHLEQAAVLAADLGGTVAR